MSGNGEVSSLMQGMAVIDENSNTIYDVNAVIAPSDVLVVATDPKDGQVRLFNIDDIRDETYLMFRSRAAAEAFLKGEEKAEAA